MKHLFTSLLASLALILGSPSTHAQVTISLSTSASELPMVLPDDEIDTTPDEPLTAAAKKARAKQKRLRAKVKDHFITSIALSNRSKTAIDFEYHSAEEAKFHFYLCVTDLDGNIYWEAPSLGEEVDNPPVVAARVAGSLDDEGDWEPEPEPVVVSLNAGKSWRSTVSVPVVIDGTPLYPGTYIITASAGTFSASAQFKIAPPIEESITATLCGHVLLGERDANGDPIESAWKAGEGFEIQVSEIREDDQHIWREPFYWSGTTNSAGKYNVTAPIGRYYISASGPNGDDWVWGEIEVTLTDGGNTKADIRILSELGPREPLDDTGVNGTVLTASGEAAANWSLYISETGGASASQRPPFAEDTSTDEDGRFSINTPDGTFEIIAMRSNLICIGYPTAYEDGGFSPYHSFPRPTFEIATGTVTVTAGHYSAIQLKAASQPNNWFGIQENVKR